MVTQERITMIKEAGTTGEFKVYKDKDAPKLLGFKGVTHPTTQEQIGPTINKTIAGALEVVAQREGNTLDKAEVIGFLEMLKSLTKPETGYFYCPHQPPELKAFPPNPC